MKIFALSIFALVASSAMADQALVHCRVAEVRDDNEFEEGLSKQEYPELEVIRTAGGKLEVSIGAMQDWRQSKGDLVQPIPAMGNYEPGYMFRYKGRGNTTYVIRTGLQQQGSAKIRRRIGYLFADPTTQSTGRLIATFYCR